MNKAKNSSAPKTAPQQIEYNGVIYQATNTPATPSTMQPDDEPVLSPNEQADHDRSVRDYPDIKFGPREYVVIDVQRSFFGLVRIWVIALFVFLIMVAMVAVMHSVAADDSNTLLTILLLVAAFLLPLTGGIIATHVYNGNRFIVTNERVFARIQLTPFAVRSQNVEIEHVEDCSVVQSNPLQLIFNYGSIRLSTVGDEQTYLFTYVDDPKAQFDIVNHVVQQVDEGEPTRYKYGKGTFRK